MSCIATSVGLGNVWRFPFAAYQNGGGAFLIPYIIILLTVGKSMYYLETVLGQFSSSNCAKIWALSPAMKGGYFSPVTISITFLIQIILNYCSYLIRYGVCSRIKRRIHRIILRIYHCIVFLLFGNELPSNITMGRLST